MDMHLQLYGSALAVYIITLFLLYKVFILMLPRVNDPVSWLNEMYYRMLRRRRHERGVQVWAGYNDRWLFSNIFILLVYIIAFLEALTLFALVEVYDWNIVMNQIVTFHELNPNVTRPNLSTDLLGIPNHYIWTFLVDFAYINLVIAIAIICVDMRIEDLRQDTVEDAFRPFKIGCLFLASHIIVLACNDFVSRCIEGQDALYLVLSS